MNSVEPIREDEDVVAMANYLKERNERDYVMFLVGIYTGLRISDILPLRAADVEKTHLVLFEKKTSKMKRIILHPQLKKVLRDYTMNMKRTQLLFPSRKTGRGKKQKPISRKRAYEILKSASEDLGFEIRIGTHTMRKTFGFRYYQQHKDVAELQEIYNHGSQTETLRYIGVMSERIEQKIYDMDRISGI
ncbi:tyrosine-type recombinase/integrase [Sporosarcina sp. P33]|uniref:tyrosine-type recombinase/integrase n=1 Tax=Sporosarcina sp. P33 TaxID=1930764 RepID=UPI0009BCE9CF|nr:tyrosine-type recombinase/integrase [Sporosarcina sp. P33]ARD47585.1 hypothetical protein SporoP33_04595 [Sporosarcina sp. P33]